MQRSALIILGCVAAVLATAVWFAASDADASSNPNATQSGATQASNTSALADLSKNKAENSNANSNPNSPLSAEGQRNRQEQLVFWQGRYERAEQVYAHYRDSTRYPPESHPISEHPDQVRPFATIKEDTKLRNAKGDVVAGIKLRTTQERVFASGADTVKLTVAAMDETGALLPITITSAEARSLAESKTLTNIVQVPLVFDDLGQGADSVAADNTFSTRLAPAAQGFAGYAGTVRVVVKINAKGQEGVAQFDVVYSPEVPATWGSVREALEAGSLNLYVKAQVKKAGRYVVSARIDDANGVPFALLQFNDEVAAGPAEFKLHLFGALVRDKKPAFPLRLRDVDGFLLYPDRYPDRAMMARLPDVVHTTARYSTDAFSPAEWTSEERERYLAEYGKDAETAKTNVDRLLAK